MKLEAYRAGVGLLVIMTITDAFIPKRRYIVLYVQRCFVAGIKKMSEYEKVHLNG